MPSLAPLALLATLATLATLVVGEEVILLTGGYNGTNYLSGNEVLGSVCPVPAFPGGLLTAPHYGHSTLLTADGLILTCGGITKPKSCLVLQAARQAWEDHSTLDQTRIDSLSVVLPSGTFLLGDDYYDETTSSFLATGSTTWSAGPEVPGGGVTGACGVPTGGQAFLLLGGRASPQQVVEYSMGSREWTQWAPMDTPRRVLSCARIGDLVVMAGGDGDFSSSSLQLVTREQASLGPMTTSRGVYFRMVTLGERLLAMGGDDGSVYLDSVEEYREGAWTRVEGTMEVARYSFGAVAAPRELVCGGTEPKFRN